VSSKQYREFADECMHWAKTARSDREKRIFLQMAETWLKAAVVADRREQRQATASIPQESSGNSARGVISYIRPRGQVFFFRRQFIRITAKAIARAATAERPARLQWPRPEQRSHLSQIFDLSACDAFEVGARSGRVSQIRLPFAVRFPRHTSGT
jgi:hypothetical protein